MKKVEDERLKLQGIEKKCRMLEETLKNRNPDLLKKVEQKTSNLAPVDNQNEK